ncbi:MAG: radical SAM family heme chaperone HemW [bacterium]
MIAKNQLYSVYIHIPFCKSKCSYCSFISFTENNNLKKLYIDELIKEIKNGLSQVKSPILKTIYIGGGTPSLLSLEELEQIITSLLNNAEFAEDIEFSIEINPATVDLAYLTGLRQLGLNRLSIGVQSFNNEILKLINRRHNSYDAVKCVEWAKQAGFNNISIDLIHGLPKQTLQNWEETLEKGISLGINHISAYGLKIEEGTEFYTNMPSELPDEDLCADLYIKTVDFLKNQAFHQYEISNFAIEGYSSRHNTAYWTNKEYFGFGIAAHGYIKGVRYSNTSDLDLYLNNTDKKEHEHTVSNKERIEEAIYLGLRLNKGINLLEFNDEYNFDILKHYEKIIQKHIKNGFLELENHFLTLTTEGFLLSNCILSDFID